jgi:hypothetical protein
LKTIADEHVATALSHRALLPLQEPLQIAPPRSRERVVLAAVEGQAHVLGLRMVAYVLEGLYAAKAAGRNRSEVAAAP